MSRTLAITGASSGIGSATARMAVAEGWRVVLGARSEDKLAALAEELGGPDHARTVRCDVQDLGQCEALVAEAVQGFGSLDALFANAGLGATEPGLGGDPANWAEMAMTNVVGLAQTVRAGEAALRASKGHVVITGSVAGRKALAGSIYGATKWAANGFAYNLRESFRGTGIRVTAIEPGMVDTPFFDQPKPDALRPEDVARSVLFALSQPAHVEIHELMILPCQAD